MNAPPATQALKILIVEDEVIVARDIAQQVQAMGYQVLGPTSMGEEAVGLALDTPPRRLDGWVRDPIKHARYAAKVLLKYKLLEWQQIALVDLQQWVAQTPYFVLVHGRYFSSQTFSSWCESLVTDLEHAGAAQRHGDQLHNG